MKYPLGTEVIPLSKRNEINEKILLLIDAGKADLVGNAAISQGYTGEGGLHGLEFTNFDNYSSFSSAKKEIENGQFFTPSHLAKEIVECISVQSSDLVADLTMGAGSFFNFLPSESNIYGCELDPKSFKVARHLYPQANLVNRDVRYYKPGIAFNYIIGNPPFNLNWETPEGRMSSQMFFMLKSAQLLQPGGILAVLVPKSFLNDDFMAGNAIEAIGQNFNFLCQAELSNKAFSYLGVKNFATKVMFYQKKFEGLTSVGTEYKATEFVPFEPSEIKNKFLLPAANAMRSVANQVKLDLACSINDWSFKNDSIRKSDGFEFRVKKYLFEIKSHPVLKDKLGKATQYVLRFRNQEKPEGMKYEEWEKIRLTEAKVLAYLRGFIKGQYKISKSGYSIYATRNGIRLHAHDAVTGKQFTTMGINDISWYSLVAERLDVRSHALAADLKPFHRLIQRKRSLFTACQLPLNQVEPSADIITFLDSYSFITPENTTASLNTIQKHDMSIQLSRPFGILSWQQGSGKSVSSYAAIKYYQAHKNIRNTILIAPPIAVTGTWIPLLRRQSADFMVIKTLSDFNQVQPGQIVVIALTTLSKVKRFAKRFVKSISNNALLVFDESDEITNYSSKRSHSVRDIFRRLRYKLLTTGTTTRNNISELYGQLELLYNNSVNFICDCPYVYFEEKLKNEDGSSYLSIAKKENGRLGIPFPARGGLQLFKSCYAPSKSTVFGIQKHNQDIYNKQSLEGLVGRTIITRKFKEIAGEGRYKLNTHKLVPKAFEVDLYTRILEELSTIIPSYFTSTGNSRKDAMLRIVRQLQLLIKSCSLPHIMTSTSELPSKAPYIANIIRKHIDERIMVGTTSVESARFYASYLQDQFKTRPVFFVSGESHDIEKRQVVVSQFKASENGILVCTQQSLSSSIDIPQCSRVIVESLQWNLPKMEQFYFRCIRFTSQRLTNIHFIVYANSIEVNLMALLTAKERLNDFIKTLDLRDHDEVMQDFGLDETFLNMLLSKVYDSDGKVQFKWGQQQVAA